MKKRIYKNYKKNKRGGQHYHIGSNTPILKAFKNKSYKQLKKKFNTNPNSDDDKDGVINKNDCRPWDKDRQDEGERMSALSYEKWLKEKRQARGYYEQDIERKKEQIDNQIKSLKKEIETTKEDGEKEISRLKRILEDNKKEDRTQYELYVEQSRKHAEEDGYEWVEPE